MGGAWSAGHTCPQTGCRKGRPYMSAYHIKGNKALAQMYILRKIEEVLSFVIVYTVIRNVPGVHLRMEHNRGDRNHCLERKVQQNYHGLLDHYSQRHGILAQRASCESWQPQYCY